MRGPRTQTHWLRVMLVWVNLWLRTSSIAAYLKIVTHVEMWSIILQRNEGTRTSLVTLLRVHPIQHVFLLMLLTLCKHQSSFKKKKGRYNGFSILNSSPKRGYLPQENSCVCLSSPSLITCHYHLFNQTTKTTVHLRLAVDLHYKALKQLTSLCFPQNHVQAIPSCKPNKNHNC